MRKIEIISLPTSDGKELEIYVSYSDGKSMDRRGYYLHFSPVEITDRGSYKLKTYVAYTGVKKFILEAKRFSEKTLKAIAGQMSDFKYIADKVATKNNFELLMPENATPGQLEMLWEQLGDIPVNDDGITEEGFYQFEAGSDREEIWSWFDSRYPGGVVKLML